jgi:hypothetical protein
MQTGIALALALFTASLAGAQKPPAGAKPPTTAEAIKKVSKLDPALAPLEKAANAAHAKLVKQPKDVKLRWSYVEASYAFSHAVMTDRGKLPPAIQYRAALGLERQTLAVNPHHQPTLDDKNMIESIYRQMGRPIPQ